MSGKKIEEKNYDLVQKEGSKRSDAELTTTAFEADDDECSDPNNYNNVDDERKTASNTSSNGSISNSLLWQHLETMNGTMITQVAPLKEKKKRQMERMIPRVQE